MSKSEPWYAGFDVVDIETTPWDEIPEDDGFHLLCPVEGCEHETEFAHLGEIRDSEWSGLSNKDHILTDGTTLKEAYCPDHALDEDNPESLPPLRQGLGVPCDSDKRLKHSADSSRSATHESTDKSDAYKGIIVNCGCEGCDRVSEFESLGHAERENWECGKLATEFSSGRDLYVGRCPEHR